MIEPHCDLCAAHALRAAMPIRKRALSRARRLGIWLFGFLNYVVIQGLCENVLGMPTSNMDRFWFATGSNVAISIGYFGSKKLRGILATGKPMANLALRIAGKRRPHLRDEWLGDLIGVPEEGITLTAGQSRRMALGFIWAAIRFRIRDLVRPAWQLIDWTLSTEQRTNATIALLVAPFVLYFDISAGLSALFDKLPGIGVEAAFVVGLTRYLRKIRGISPADTCEENRDDRPS